MEIIKLNLNNGRDFSDKLVVTIGSFDGIHLGHKKIFEKMEEIY